MGFPSYMVIARKWFASKRINRPVINMFWGHFRNFSCHLLLKMLLPWHFQPFSWCQPQKTMNTELWFYLLNKITREWLWSLFSSLEGFGAQAVEGKPFASRLPSCRYAAVQRNSHSFPSGRRRTRSPRMPLPLSLLILQIVAEGSAMAGQRGHDGVWVRLWLSAGLSVLDVPT